MEVRKLVKRELELRGPVLKKTCFLILVTSVMSTNAALLFLKPNVADNMEVRKLVRKELELREIKLIDEGEVKSEIIARDGLIDNHYFAIASKAVRLKPYQLDVPKTVFEGKFNLSWKEALKNNLCLNAQDAMNKWGLTPEELSAKWRAAKADSVKFGGGFYCAKIDDYFVFNGFFMEMRNQYIAEGKMIYYFKVEWSPSEHSWQKFREDILGLTDPSRASKLSLRGIIYNQWKKLGLSQQPNTGLNSIHGSASAFEALIERMNWCGDSLDSDPFGRQLLNAGISKESISKWTKDPQVITDESGNKEGFFDHVEDMDSDPTVDVAKRIQELNSTSSSWHSTALITIAVAGIGAYVLYKLKKSSENKADE